VPPPRFVCSASPAVKILAVNLSPIWRRRVVLMAIVGLVIAIPITLVIRGSDDEAEPASSTVAENPPLNPEVSDHRLDADYSVPKRWRLNRKASALTLSSPDKTVRIGISAPGPAEDAGQVLDEAVISLRASYESVEVSPGSGRRVGGLPAKGAVVSARGDNVNLRILVAAMEGEKRAYLVEVFTAASAPASSVAEAQLFLDSLRLRG
jgi:hypothetical protein